LEARRCVAERVSLADAETLYACGLRTHGRYDKGFNMKIELEKLFGKPLPVNMYLGQNGHVHLKEAEVSVFGNDNMAVSVQISSAGGNLLTTIVMLKDEWETIGKKARWIK
jgi:hypothetical protein